jgi:Rrf2 family iron-sulfur cluster assembly transcriptional regulator
MIYLSHKEQIGSLIGVKEIAAQIKSPEAFTAKILQQLVKHGVLDSLRGPGGGFQLKDISKKTTLAEIVVAIDGDGMIKNCVLGLYECSQERPCTLHHQFVALRNQFSEVLLSTTIKEVADNHPN